MVRALVQKKWTLFSILAIIAIALVGCSNSENQRLTEEVATLNTSVETLQDQLNISTEKAANLETAVHTLSGNSASGGGINLKFMPDPKTGEMTAPLPEIFTFDRNHAICRVETNPVPFVMPTFGMGDVTIDAHNFYMSMVATEIEEYLVSTDADGSTRVVMTGGLDCFTEVGQAEVTFGDRTASEHATFRITAVDKGLGGGQAGDNFEFTVFFDEKDAPLNHTIFGPEFTFTGEMIAGEVTITDPKQLK